MRSRYPQLEEQAHELESLVNSLIDVKLRELVNSMRQKLNTIIIDLETNPEKANAETLQLKQQIDAFEKSAASRATNKTNMDIFAQRVVAEENNVREKLHALSQNMENLAQTNKAARDSRTKVSSPAVAAATSSRPMWQPIKAAKKGKKGTHLREKTRTSEERAGMRERQEMLDNLKSRVRARMEETGEDEKTAMIAVRKMATNEMNRRHAPLLRHKKHQDAFNQLIGKKAPEHEIEEQSIVDKQKFAKLRHVDPDHDQSVKELEQLGQELEQDREQREARYMLEMPLMEFLEKTSQENKTSAIDELDALFEELKAERADNQPKKTVRHAGEENKRTSKPAAAASSSDPAEIRRLANEIADDLEKDQKWVRGKKPGA